VDTLVDPVETLSSSQMRAAKPAPSAPRPSLPSIDTDASVQWFSRLDEPAPAPALIDIEIAWDEDSDTSPTLVIRRPAS
jgi:hypothetical protein